jgi:hypothetical protein
MSPAQVNGESGGMTPTAFRALLAQIFGPNAQNAPVAVTVAATKKSTSKAALKRA